MGAPMTFGEIQDQIRRDFGWQNATADPENDAQIRSLINAELVALTLKARWHFWLTVKQEILALGATSCPLPLDFTALLLIRDFEERPVRVRDAADLLRYKARREANGTYACSFGPVDAATGARTLMIAPALTASDSWDIWYYRLPATLAADADIPDLPSEYHSYLVWAAAVRMLHGVRERQLLYEEAKENRNTILQEMKNRNNAEFPPQCL